MGLPKFKLVVWLNDHSVTSLPLRKPVFKKKNPGRFYVAIGTIGRCRSSFHLYNTNYRLQQLIFVIMEEMYYLSTEPIMITAIKETSYILLNRGSRLVVEFVK